MRRKKEDFRYPSTSSRYARKAFTVGLVVLAIIALVIVVLVMR